MNIFHNPVNVFWGDGSISKLNDCLIKLACRNILVLTGKSSLKKSGYFEKITEILSGCNVVSVECVSSHPDTKEVLEINQKLALSKFDTILAVGGGSVLDVAKAIKALIGERLSDVQDLEEILSLGKYSPAEISIIAVPTTSGSGSEVTPWATIWDRKNKKKYSIEHPALYPDCSIVDPEITYSLPIRTSVICSLDALCHAVESYWAKPSNEYSRQHSLSAISLIIDNVETLCQEGSSEAVRSNLSLGSLHAGLAFSHTKTTACHAIAYPLTLHFSVEHGIATTMTLASLLQINYKVIPNVDRLFTALKVENTNELHEKLLMIGKMAGISLRLRDYGVKEEDLAEIVTECFTRGRMDNNPITLDKGIVLDVLKQIF